MDIKASIISCGIKYNMQYNSKYKKYLEKWI